MIGVCLLLIGLSLGMVISALICIPAVLLILFGLMAVFPIVKITKGGQLTLYANYILVEREGISDVHELNETASLHVHYGGDETRGINNLAEWRHFTKGTLHRKNESNKNHLTVYVTGEPPIRYYFTYYSFYGAFFVRRVMEWKNNGINVSISGDVEALGLPH